MPHHLEKKLHQIYLAHWNEQFKEAWDRYKDGEITSEINRRVEKDMQDWLRKNAEPQKPTEYPDGRIPTSEAPRYTGTAKPITPPKPADIIEEKKPAELNLSPLVAPKPEHFTQAYSAAQEKLATENSDQISEGARQRLITEARQKDEADFQSALATYQIETQIQATEKKKHEAATATYEAAVKHNADEKKRFENDKKEHETQLAEHNRQYADFKARLEVFNKKKADSEEKWDKYEADHRDWSTRQARFRTESYHRRFKEVHAEYDARFKEAWEKKVEPHIAQKLQMTIATTFEILSKRHPWIIDELNSAPQFDGTYADACMQACVNMVINDGLLRPRSDIEQASSGWSEENMPSGMATLSQKLIANMTQNYITDFPIAKANHQLVHQLPAFYEPLTQGTIPSLQFGRLDLYRYLENSNISLLEMTPLLFDELDKLTTAHKERLKTAIVNIGDESKPTWVVLERQPGTNNWQCYADSGMVKHAQLEAIKEKLHASDIQLVEVKHQEDHQPQQSVNDFDKKATWHLTVLARILPYCHHKAAHDGQAGELAQYRQTVAIDRMFESVAPLLVINTKPNIRVDLRYALQNSAPYYDLRDTQKLFSTKAVSRSSSNKLAGRTDEKAFLLDDDQTRDMLDLIDPVGFNESCFEARYAHGTPIAAGVIHRSSTNTNEYDTVVAGQDTVTAPKFPLLQAVYHSRKPHLHISSASAIPSIEENSKAHLLTRELIKTNTELQSVTLAEGLVEDTHHNSQKQLAIYSSEVAARNRFLATWRALPRDPREPDYIVKRKKLWETAGKHVYDYNQTHQAAECNLEFINQYKSARALWVRRKACSHYDEQALVQQYGKEMWQRLQIAQMGPTATEAYFKQIDEKIVQAWNAESETPVLNTPLFLDLGGNHNESPDEYIKAITAQLEQLYQKKMAKRGCPPLFKSIHLVLPERHPDNFMDLLDVINKYCRDNSQESSRVYLYNLPLDRNDAIAQVMQHLDERAKRKGNEYRSLIHCPELDQKADLAEDYGQAKSRYRQLQNTILNNQRAARAQALKVACTALDDPSPVIAENRALEVLANEGKAAPPAWYSGGEEFEKKSYPLVASISTNTDQQLEQQNEQVNEQVHERSNEREIAVNEELEEETEAEVERYLGDESQLITRQNIRDNPDAQSLWAALSQTQQTQFAAIGDDSIARTFSRLVGSDKDAEHVISKIEPAAFERLLQCPLKTRLGLSTSNLPAGFYLATGDNNAQILCYSARREAIAKRGYTGQENAKKRPFKVILDEPEQPEQFHGDYRQFYEILVKSSLITSQVNLSDRPADADVTKVNYLSVLWKFLSHNQTQPPESLDTVWKTIVATSGGTAGNPNVELGLQVHDAERQSINGVANSEQLTHSNCNTLLRVWAAKAVHTSSTKGRETYRQVSNALFSDVHFSEANLKAFGQLFNRFDTTTGVEAAASGSTRFLQLADKIYRNFGQDKFLVWKKAFLDPSQNLTELLRKDEVDAVVSSIDILVKLNRKEPPENEMQAYADVWWKLAEAHVAATGHTRYAHLWNAYHRLLKAINKHKLKLKHGEVLGYFERVIKSQQEGTSSTSEHFDGIVMLDRLYHALEESAKRPDPTEAQQFILDNMGSIDWTHSGFHYASKFNGYHRWFPALKLSAFEAANHAQDPNYLTAVDPRFPETSWHVTALRHYAKNKRCTNEEFRHLEQLLVTVDARADGDGRKALIARLILLCKLRGGQPFSGMELDAIERFNQCKPETLVAINEQFEIDAPSESFDVAFNDMPSLAQALEHGNTLEAHRLHPALVNATARHLKMLRSATLQSSGAVPAEMAVEEQRAQELGGVLAAQPQLFVSGPISDTYQICPWLAGASVINLRTCNETQRKFCVQLQSVDFSSSTGLPDATRVTRMLQSLSDSEPKATRKTRAELVKELEAMGCKVTIADTYFRKLTDDDRNVLKHAQKEARKKLLKTFHSTNLALLNTLLKDYSAFPADANEDALNKLVENFIDILIKIDSKDYFNDLGLVLGTLIKTAKDGGRTYSLPQLGEWLELMCPKKTNKHYQATLLETLLSKENSATNSGILNQNLAALTTSALAHSDSNASDESLYKAVKSVMDCGNEQAVPGQPQHVNARDKELLLKIAMRPGLRIGQAQQPYLQYCEDKLLKTYYPQGQRNSLLRLMVVAAEKALRNQVPTVLELWLDFLAEPLSSLGIDDHFSGLHTLTGQGIANHLSKAGANSWLNKLQLHQCVVPAERQKSLYILMILASASIGSDGQPNFDTDSVQSEAERVVGLLQKRDVSFCKALAQYYQEDPRPKLQFIENYLNTHPHATADKLQHDFETKEQATSEIVVIDEEGNKHKKTLDKRTYSITNEDNEQLCRILGSLKRKGQAFVSDEHQKQLVALLQYCNSYATSKNLHDIDATKLRQRLDAAVDKVRLQRNGPNTEDYLYSKAELLAIMREVLLRKHGMWANHTQMIMLLFAGMHNNESMVHQVKTGQGKSLLTFMRVAFKALTGRTVNVFSAKEALSERDQAEFAHVYRALGINSTLVTPTSEPGSYLRSSDQTREIGAVNYAVIGGLCLFRSANAWNGTDVSSPNDSKVLPEANFVDEFDASVEEETLFRQVAAGNQKTSRYNYDAWIFDVAYDFYNKRIREKVDGGNTIVTDDDFRELYRALYEASLDAPQESNFMQVFMEPANDEKLDEDRRKLHVMIRNQALRKLITATYVANKKLDGGRDQMGGPDYAVRDSKSVLPDGTLFPIRVATVVNNNQPKPGSKYGEWVQSALHTRLNRLAAERGEPANFHIDPDEGIALVENTEHFLHECWERQANIEGCTGTAGDASELESYQKRFGIGLVTKIDTHEESRSVSLGQVFCKDENEQIAEIAKMIVSSAVDGPILVTCKSDTEVKHLGQKVLEFARKLAIEKLGKKITAGEDPLRQLGIDLYLDTNQSELSEAEMVPLAGKKGRVTFSARAGRGTNIKPDKASKKSGLTVITTAPEKVRNAKQGIGRQGRNGDPGRYISIFNGKDIDNTESAYLNGPYKERYQEILAHQRQHLEKKLRKHQKKQASGKKKNTYAWMYTDTPANTTRDTAKIEMYLKARAIVKLRLEIEKIDNRDQMRKDFLITVLCKTVEAQLTTLRSSGQSKAVANLREQWPLQLERINVEWNNRSDDFIQRSAETQAEKMQLREDIYRAFQAKVKAITTPVLGDLAEKIDQIDAEWLVRNPLPGQETTQDQTLEETQQSDAPVVLSVYQSWCAGSKENYTVRDDRQISEATQSAFFGSGEQLRELYKLLHSLDSKADPSSLPASPVRPHGAAKATAGSGQAAMTAAEQADTLANPYNREVLFSHIQRLMYNEASEHADDGTLGEYNRGFFMVPVSDQSEMLKRLCDIERAQFPSQAQISNYSTRFDLMARYFSQNRWQERDPLGMQAVDIHCHGAVAKCVLAMVESAAVAENYSHPKHGNMRDLLSRYVQRFGHNIEAHLAKQRHLNPVDAKQEINQKRAYLASIEHKLKLLFGSDKTILELLAPQSNDDDQTHLLQLLCQADETKINQFRKFLLKNKDMLQRERVLIWPVTELSLKYGANNIPVVDCIQGALPPVRLAYWQLLARSRPPINKDTGETLAAKLADNATQSYQLLASINQIPAGIQLEELLETLSDSLGYTNVTESKQRLEQLTAAGNAFNAFCDRRDVHKEFVESIATREAFYGLFKVLPPTESAELFKRFNESDCHGIPGKMLYGIAMLRLTLHNENIYHRKYIVDALQLAKDVVDLQSTGCAPEIIRDLYALHDEWLYQPHALEDLADEHKAPAGDEDSDDVREQYKNRLTVARQYVLCTQTLMATRTISADTRTDLLKVVLDDVRSNFAEKLSALYDFYGILNGTNLDTESQPVITGIAIGISQKQLTATHATAALACAEEIQNFSGLTSQQRQKLMGKLHAFIASVASDTELLKRLQIMQAQLEAMRSIVGQIGQTAHTTTAQTNVQRKVGMLCDYFAAGSTRTADEIARAKRVFLLNAGKPYSESLDKLHAELCAQIVQNNTVQEADRLTSVYQTGTLCTELQQTSNCDDFINTWFLEYSPRLVRQPSQGVSLNDWQAQLSALKTLQSTTPYKLTIPANFLTLIDRGASTRTFSRAVDVYNTLLIEFRRRQLNGQMLERLFLSKLLHAIDSRIAPDRILSRFAAIATMLQGASLAVTPTNSVMCLLDNLNLDTPLASSDDDMPSAAAEVDSAKGASETDDTVFQAILATVPSLCKFNCSQIGNPLADVFDQYLVDVITTRKTAAGGSVSSEHYQDIEAFISTVHPKLDKVALTPSMLQTLLRWYVDDFRSTHQGMLDQILDDLACYKRLRDRKTDLDSLYLEMEQSNEARLSILRLSYLGLLDADLGLEPAKHDQHINHQFDCYREFVMNNLGEVPHSNLGSDAKARRTALLQQCTTLGHLAADISLVIQPLPGTTAGVVADDASSDGSQAATVAARGFRRGSGLSTRAISQASAAPSRVNDTHQQRYRRLFEAQRKNYDSEWWVNSARRQQAKDLFDQLERLSRNQNVSPDDYYQQLMRQITLCQQKIRADGEKQNTKGYSRLYDITIQLEVAVMKGWLGSAGISPQQLLQAQLMLLQSLEKHIQALQEKLPSGSPLIDEIYNYSTRTAPNKAVDVVGLKTLAQALDTNRALVAPGHQYLVDACKYSVETVLQSASRQAAGIQAKRG